jgi:hypothetical protein
MMPSRVDVMDQLTRVSVCLEILSVNGIPLVHNCDNEKIAEKLRVGLQGCLDAYKEYTETLEETWRIV